MGGAPRTVPQKPGKGTARRAPTKRNRDLCYSPLSCHSEGAERPKNLISTRKYEILHCVQDDKMAFCRGLRLLLAIALSEKIALNGQAEQTGHWGLDRMVFSVNLN